MQLESVVVICRLSVLCRALKARVGIRSARTPVLAAGTMTGAVCDWIVVSLFRTSLVRWASSSGFARPCLISHLTMRGIFLLIAARKRFPEPVLFSFQSATVRPRQFTSFFVYSYGCCHSSAQLSDLSRVARTTTEAFCMTLSKASQDGATGTGNDI